MGKSDLIKISKLKKELKTCSHDELVELISELSKIDELVQEFLTFRFAASDNGIQNILEGYKAKIEHEFFPTRGFGKLNLKEAKRVISDFKKICKDKVKVIDLMLYYVENGVDFTNTYGDISDNFYGSLEGVYRQVIKIINEETNNNLYLAFSSRLEMIVSNTSGIGWGFHDNLTDYYHELQWLNNIDD